MVAIFILFNLISSISNSEFKNIFVWALVFGGYIWVVKEIKNQSKPVDKLSTSADTEKDETAKINSEKHGCKCYMDGLTNGEQEIAHILAEGLSYKDYFIFNNLTIPSDYNGSSQIDHLVISRFGIFVIESKEFQGLVLGDKNQDKWTESFGNGKNVQFQNPLRQNWSHIMSLKKLFPFISEDNFKNIVVFVGSKKFVTQPIESVVHSEEIVGCIQKHTESKLSEENLHVILGKLSYLCQTADISHEQHLRNLHASHPEVNS